MEGLSASIEHNIGSVADKDIGAEYEGDERVNGAKEENTKSGRHQ